MQQDSLAAIGRLRPFQGLGMPILDPADFTITGGGTFLDSHPETVVAFMDKHRPLYGYCLVAMSHGNSKLLEPGTVVMSNSRADLIHYLLRWHALKATPVWVDTFDQLPPFEQKIRTSKLEILERARAKTSTGQLGNRAQLDRLDAALSTLRTGHWEMTNLPPLEGLRWPTGREFGLTNPEWPNAKVESSYLDHLFTMIERRLPFTGPAGSVSADALFGVSLMTPATGYELMMNLHVFAMKGQHSEPARKASFA